MATKLSTMDLVKPVPAGISWTAPPKGRPWTTPPKLTDMSEIAQLYIDKLSSAEIMNSILDVVETKVPLASMAEVLMLSGVNSGTHTIDTGILVMPVIVEMLKTAAEMHGVEYIIFSDDEAEKDVVSDRVVRQAIKEATSPKEEPAPMVEPQVELSGLMSRKPNMENM